MPETPQTELRKDAGQDGMSFELLPENGNAEIVAADTAQNLAVDGNVIDARDRFASGTVENSADKYVAEVAAYINRVGESVEAYRRDYVASQARARRMATRPSQSFSFRRAA